MTSGSPENTLFSLFYITRGELDDVKKALGAFTDAHLPNVAHSPGGWNSIKIFLTQLVSKDEYATLKRYQVDFMRAVVGLNYTCRDCEAYLNQGILPERVRRKRTITTPNQVILFEF